MSKQFNIKGNNGLYLAYKPELPLDISNYNNLLIEDFNFFPSNTNQANLYDFKNAKYEDQSKLIGSNSTQKSNSIFKYSEITIKDELVANKKYYNTFKLYFRFFGSTMSKYTLSGVPGNTLAAIQILTKKILDRLRVKIFVTIGSNEIPMELDDLEKYDYTTSTWVPVTTGDVTGAGNISNGNYGIQLTTGLNSVDCIDMAYTGITTTIIPLDSTPIVDELFNSYNQAPDNYNFRVKASFPDFDQIAKKTKNYKITIKYYNIGVSGAGSTYSNSESVELMSNSFVFYEQLVSSVIPND